MPIDDEQRTTPVPYEQQVKAEQAAFERKSQALREAQQMALADMLNAAKSKGLGELAIDELRKSAEANHRERHEKLAETYRDRILDIKIRFHGPHNPDRDRERER